jgi:nitrogen fixation protein FixH
MLTWAGVIVGLLSLQVALCVVGVTLAVRGKGVVVESDYYTKALHWDQQKALLQASRDLGWNVGLDVGPTATTRGDRAVVITLVDRAGTPIDDAGVELAYFHHAAPRDLRQAPLKATGGGAYLASIPLERAGHWEFRLTIRRGAGAAGAAGAGGAEPGGQMFVETVTRDIGP